MAKKSEEIKSTKPAKAKPKTTTKKVVKKVIEEVQEDKNIKKVANSCCNCQSFSCCALIVLFAFVLLSSVTLMAKNYWQKSYNEIISKSNFKNNVLIVNNGDVKKSINNTSFNNDSKITITNINSIELTTNKNASEKGVVAYDVKYEVNKNSFKKNMFATTDSEVLVKFSYSYDGENWTYINNALTTLESTVNPLMGNNYDIAGIDGTIKVATNYKLESPINESKIIYWRSETIFQKVDGKDSNGDFDAVFKIEYKSNKQ